MAYGTVKVDNITFTNGGIDQTVTVSGIVQSISGDITATGTIQGATIIGTSTVSGATVTGDAGVFTTVTGGSAGFTTVTGTTVTGTTANFNVGTFTSQVSGATVTGNLAQFTSVTGGTAGFTTVTGTTVTGTTANFVTVSGTTVTGNAGQFTNITGTSAGFTTITGATVTGSVGNFGSGSEAAPSVSVGTTDNGIYSPGADQVAISTNGTGRLFVDASGRVGVGTASPGSNLHIKDSGYAGIILQSDRTDTAQNIGGLTFRDSVGNDKSQVRSTVGGDLAFDTNATERARITSNGKLGLGTSAPGALLDVAGNSGTTTPTLRISNLFNGTPTELSQTALEFYSGDQSTPSTASVRAKIDVLTSVNGGSSDALRFFINGATGTLDEALRIDREKRVGVGTTGPGEKLDVADGHVRISNNYFYRAKDSTGVGRNVIGINTSDSTLIGTKAQSGRFLLEGSGSSEAARIDSSGRLLVGTSSVRSAAGLAGQLLVEGTTYSQSTISAVANVSSGTLGAFITLAKTRGSTIGSATIVNENDTCGDIRFAGADGNNLIHCAGIYAQVDGTPGVNDMPGRLVFSTTADGASSVTERMRIDSSGRVGVGTTALSTYGGKLVVVDGAVGGETTLVLANSSQDQFARLGINNNEAQIAWDNGDALVFGTATTSATSGLTSEFARIDSSGRLLVGTSSARTDYKYAGFSVTPIYQVEADGADASIGITRNANSVQAPSIYLGKSRGSVAGDVTIVNSGDRLGSLSFNGADGSSLLQAARIDCEVDGTPGANDMPGRLVFSTTADGASSPTERMRITSDGSVYIGKESDSSSTSADVGFTCTGQGFLRVVRDSDICGIFHRFSSDGTILAFRRDATQVGTISVTTTATAYNTSSDYRLKENVTPVTDGITRLQQLKPSRFNFIADPDTTVDGFLAHEVQDIVPEAITGEKNAVDDEGNPEYQGIDQSKLVPLLTAALQEAVAKIESLEARLTAAGL